MMGKAILYVKGHDIYFNTIKSPKTPLRRNKGAIKNINDGKIKTVMYVKERGKITNKEYQNIAQVSKPTASRELAVLVNNKILKREVITGKGTFYLLIKGFTNGSKKQMQLYLKKLINDTFLKTCQRIDRGLIKTSFQRQNSF